MTEEEEMGQRRVELQSGVAVPLKHWREENLVTKDADKY